jgi:hypothetical protein
VCRLRSLHPSAIEGSSILFCDGRQVEVQGEKTDCTLPVSTCFLHVETRIRAAVLTETINGRLYFIFRL